MANKSKHVLIVASLEISRKPTLILSEKLAASGYTAVFCHTGKDEFKISEDRILEQNMSLSGLAGVVFLDDGGDSKSAIQLAKLADKADIVVGLFQAGCIIGKDAKIFKNRYLCSGLPEDYYKGAKETNAPCVRSGNLVVSAGECFEGFVELVIGALGGKSKTIITSGPNSPEVTKACSDGTALQTLSTLFDIGKKFSERDLDNIIKQGSKNTAIFPDRSVRILGRGKFAIALGIDSHQILFKEELTDLLKEANLSKCQLVVDGLETEISIAMARTEKEWNPISKEAILNGRPTPHTSILQKAMGEKAEAFIQKCESISLQACLLIESSLEDPDKFKYLKINFSSMDNDPKVVKVSAIPSYSAGVDQKELLLRKKLLEREMAYENIFPQENGKIGIEIGDETKILEPWDAAELLTKMALNTTNEAIRKKRSMRSLADRQDYVRSENLVAILRHKIRILLQYLEVSKLVKRAEVDIDGVSGWYSNMDLPMKERVWQFSEDEQDFTNDDKWIKRQPRYNPEYYEMGDPKSTSGFYYVWWEIANNPYYWSRILEDGIYPMVMSYKGIGS